MSMSLRRPLASLALGLTLALALPVAHALKVGDTVAVFTLKDQKGTDRTLDAGTRRIYANAGRKSDGVMKEAKIEQARLNAQKAIVVADISAAPGFVKSIIKSSLKDRRYDTWIDTKGSTQKTLAYKEDQIAIIELDQLKVKAIRYVASVEALQKELAQP